ncbi:pentapeptide repeat-containing protein, partial [Streptomyces microflavus]|uniref:pentapeptide repeat-containing protein n=1 Tax=Streptomyces microflavus TaxID=1919 RepID=UPI0036A6D82F
VRDPRRAASLEEANYLTRLRLSATTVTGQPLAERYTKAAEQLGHDQAAVRLAGVYAMARLADDWEEQRRVCVNVLCAYLRMPYETDTGAEGYMKGEREVRLTIIRTIRDHLQDPATATTWCGYDLDFTDAVFDGGDFAGVQLIGGTVSFSGATFSAGTVHFSGATFSGSTVHFNRATFSGSTVHFNRATFSGSTIYFNAATFSSGTVNFSTATFSGGRVHFNAATFSGSGALFNGAKFSGSTVNFNVATFSGGRVDFNGATFSSGTVSFGIATLSGATVAFHRATFSGATVTLSRAIFSGGRVDFEDARIHAACTIIWGPLPTIPVNQF